jgi:hypothetical protein
VDHVSACTQVVGKRANTGGQALGMVEEQDLVHGLYLTM